MECKEKIIKWLDRIERDSLIPTDIVAFYFGLFEREEGYCIYLTGSAQYDETDDDWACNVDFKPRDNTLELTSREVGEMDWEEFQHTVKEIISAYIVEAPVGSMFRIRQRIVTVGFDDGELEKVEWQKTLIPDTQGCLSYRFREKEAHLWCKAIDWLKHLFA